MAAAAAEGGGTSSNTKPDLDPEQMRQIVSALSRKTRKPKAKEPEVYRGEQHQENIVGWSTVVLNAAGPPRGVVVPVVHQVHTDPL